MISASHRIGERKAKQVVASGLAGRATRRGSALLYAEDLIDALIDRPPCRPEVLDRWRPLVVRIGMKAGFQVDAPWPDQARWVTGPWHFPLTTGAVLAYRSTLQPASGMRHPMIGVLAGWVVIGAEITGRDGTMITVEPPGAWFEDFRDTWIALPGKRPWHLWGPPSTRAAAADSLAVTPVTDLNVTASSAEHSRRAEAQTRYQDVRAAETVHADNAPVRANGRL
ncbi:MAG: hypothetical protein J2O46_05450 [Nocardioides sp.]|nr:hypothetical protein [Nocardioides sp.]